MDLTTARARIHAMFTALDEAATDELDQRLDELIAAARDSQPQHREAGSRDAHCPEA